MNYIHEHCFTRDDPAVNNHSCYITKERFNQDFTTHNIYNDDRSNTYTVNNHNYIFLKQNNTTHVISYITYHNKEQHSLFNTDTDSNTKRDYVTHNHIEHVFRTISNIGYIEDHLAKTYGNRAIHNTSNITKHYYYYYSYMDKFHSAINNNDNIHILNTTNESICNTKNTFNPNIIYDNLIGSSIYNNKQVFSNIDNNIYKYVCND